jgi:hypothetical protein
LAVVGDTTLAVKNTGRKRIELFDLASLGYRGGLLNLGASSDLSSWKGSLIIGALRADSGYAYAVVTDSSKPPLRGGSVPAMYVTSPLVAQAFGTVQIARDDSTVVGIFEVSNTAYRWHLSSSQIDSVVMPVRTRRGAKPDVIRQLLVDPSKAATLAFAWSMPMLTATLSNTRTLFIWYDPTMVKGQYVGPAYAQVVDWSRKSACAEIRLPVPADVPPRYGVRGDTLVALVQHPAGTDGTSSWIVRWRIRADIC